MFKSLRDTKLGITTFIPSHKSREEAEQAEMLNSRPERSTTGWCFPKDEEVFTLYLYDSDFFYIISRKERKTTEIRKAAMIMITIMISSSSRDFRSLL